MSRPSVRTRRRRGTSDTTRFFTVSAVLASAAMAGSSASAADFGGARLRVIDQALKGHASAPTPTASPANRAPPTPWPFRPGR